MPRRTRTSTPVAGHNSKFDAVGSNMIRGYSVPRKGPAIRTYEDEWARAERMIKFIEKLCYVPEGKLVGNTFQLLPFEIEFIKAVYRTRNGRRIVRRALLSMARKNGKTALIACLLLGHLIGPEAVQNSQLYSTAQSKDQAGIVFKLLTKITRQHPSLSSNLWLRDLNKEAYGIGSGANYTALSANSITAYGLSPLVAIHDELGQAGAICPIFDAVETGMGAHEEPLSIIISTQAADDLSLLSNFIDDAISSPEEQTHLQLYSAEADCDIMDQEAWEAANPAIDVYRSRSDIEDQAAKVKRIPSREPVFRNLTLNQRVNTIKAFLTKSIWDKNAGDVLLSACKGKKAWAAIDLSSRVDLTAMVVIIEHDDGTTSLIPYCWLPEAGIEDRELKDKVPYRMWAKQGHLFLTPGSSIDYAWVVEQIKMVIGMFDVQCMAFDRWRIEFLKTLLDAAGVVVPLLPFGQGYKDMAPALEAFESLAVDGRIRHGNHPVLRWCMANSKVISDPAGNRKLDKARSTSRIDPSVASVMAIGSRHREVEKPRGEPKLIVI